MPDDGILRDDPGATPAVPEVREGVFQTTPDGLILSVSPEVAHMLGYASPEELIQAVPNVRSLYADLARRSEVLRELRDHGTVLGYEISFRRKDGSLIWTSSDIQLVREANGAMRYVGKLIDITDRKQAEEAVRKASRRAVQGRRISITVELVLLGGLTALVYGLAARFNWFEATIGWIRAKGDANQLDEIVVAGLFLIVGISVFAFRRWHESELKMMSNRVAHEAERLLQTELEGRVSRRTAELAQVNTALRDSEKKFQAVFDQAAVGVLIAEGPRGRYLHVNRRFCEIVGYTAAELQHLTSQDITHPDDLAADTRQLDAISTGTVREFSREKRFRRKDGTFVWVRVFVAPLDPAEARPTLRIGVIEDITEPKRVEEALTKSEAYYRTLFNNMLNGYAFCRMIFVDGRARDFTYVSVNPAFEALTGLKNVVGRNVSEVIPGLRDSDPQLLETFGRVALTGVPERFEQHVAALDQWFSISIYSPQREYIVVIFDVITARKQAELSLRQSEERYRLFFESNPLAMWLYDLETLRFLAVNDAAVQHYGYTRAEFLGMTIKDIRPVEDIPAMIESVEAGLTAGATASTWRHRRKDGQIIHVEVVSRPLVFHGRAARLVLASDITEKKLLEEKFLHAQRLENLGMLAAGIAHDLNNVLAPISFIAPLLRQHLSDPRDLKILGTLEQSAARGAGLVRQILGFAHATTGEFQPTQVKHLVRDILGVIEETFPKSIELEQQIPADLWLVQGNPTQIHQVLLNLCVNARDAMPQGGRLRLAAANRRLDATEASAIPGARPGSWVVIEVADSGTGIPPEVLARIWDPFFTTKGPDKGTGLGLSTVRGLVTSHLGFVQLETAVGRGTTFRVFLPALESSASRPKTVAPFAVPDGQGELVLVVDDEAAFCDLVTTTLEDHGYRVASCRDGVEAIALYATRQAEFSLVITDVDMPRLGGVALARALLRIYPSVRILAMSGLSRGDSDATEVSEMKALAHAFLVKPFKAEALLGAVHHLLHPAKPG